MLPPLFDCCNCDVRTNCLPFRIGLIQLGSKETRREVEERKAGELVIDRRQPGKTLVVRKGWVGRFVLFADGRRQITDVVLPGDFIGCNEMVASGEALPAVALSDAEVCVFDRDKLIASISSSAPRLLELMKVCGSQAIRLRYLLATMGRQSGVSRVAAFLLGLYNRLKDIGRASEAQMPYHLRQQDLADILGMTQVHVSRTMRTLRDAGVVKIERKIAFILNLTKLERLAKA
jgi:CRP-like cAMP-binding protein